MSREGANDEEAHFLPNRIKFPCSYGGKILPLSSDGQLKYIGGETRIISVPRSITFQEFKDRINGMFSNCEIVIKYQIYPEDLDTLVTVRSDEDLLYMLEEFDRHESMPHSPSSSPRFRVFVFPSTKINSSTSSPTHHSSVMTKTKKIPVPTSKLNSISGTDVISSKSHGPPQGMQRVRSTPDLSQMGNNSSIGLPIVGSRLNTNPPRYNQSSQHMNVTGHGGGGGGGGSGRGDMSKVGVSYRYETCVCGRVILGHQRRRRKYQYPRYVGPPMCAHQNTQVHECHGSHYSLGGSVNFSGTSPGLQRQSIRE